MSKRRMLWMLRACFGMGGLLLAAWPGPARAIDLDGIKVTPSTAYQGEYDDNIFRTKSNKRTDYANHFIPAIKLEATPGKHQINAGLSADIIRYSSHTNLNTERYNANFNSIFSFNRLELRGREDFRHTDDFPSSELTKRIKRDENSLGGGFDLDLYSQWGLGFDYTWGNTYYLDHSFDFLDVNSYTYATNFYYRLTAKTRVFAEYDFVQEWFGYDSSRDDKRHRAMLGARGDFTDRFSLTAKGGYERVNFLNSSSNDQNAFTISLQANYKPVDRVQIVLILLQEPIPSSFTGNPVYTPLNATLGITYAFTPKILIIPHGSFGVDSYPNGALNPDTSQNEKRRDYILGGGLSLRYEPQKWLRLDANYEYQTRQSKFSSFNYNDNRIWFTVAFSI